MTDYTKDMKFWQRLENFAKDVQTNCMMGEEEKEMILHNCKLKIQEYQNTDEKRNLLIDFLAKINGYLIAHPHLQMSTDIIDEYLEKKKN